MVKSPEFTEGVVHREIAQIVEIVESSLYSQGDREDPGDHDLLSTTRGFLPGGGHVPAKSPSRPTENRPRALPVMRRREVGTRHQNCLAE
jgi:hypothetical protein